MRIKKGDLVKVIAGDKAWKGKTGRVLEVFPKNQRLRIEGVRPIKRHIKPQRNPRHPEGGIIEDTGTVHVSNVMLMSEVHDRPVRTGSVFTESGNKQRVARGRGLKSDPV
jgi:large subunit ribosomal protein L24